MGAKCEPESSSTHEQSDGLAAVPCIDSTAKRNPHNETYGGADEENDSDAIEATDSFKNRSIEAFPLRGQYEEIYRRAKSDNAKIDVEGPAPSS